MDDSLKSNLSQIRWTTDLGLSTKSTFLFLFSPRNIGEKLHQLEDKLPKFRQHLSDLEADHKRVSGAHDEMLARHEATFLAVSRDLELGEERRLRAREMETRQPIKYAKYSQHLNSHHEARFGSGSRSAKIKYIYSTGKWIRIWARGTIFITRPETERRWIQSCQVLYHPSTSEWCDVICWTLIGSWQLVAASYWQFVQVIMSCRDIKRSSGRNHVLYLDFHIKLPAGCYECFS